MGRRYINTEDNLFDETTEILEEMKNFFYYFRCKTCGKISSKCILKRGGKLRYDFNCTKCNRKRTNLEKFGCENPFSNEKIKEKIRKNNLEKYGVENINELKFVRDKITKTKKERYGENFEGIVNTQKQSFLKKYGVDNPQKVKDIQEQTKQTNLQRYGSTCTLNSPKVKEKCRNTMLKLYGVDSPLKSEELKKKVVETNLERYGVENVFQNELVKEKYKETMVSKYGVEHPLQLDSVQQAVKQGKLKSDKEKALEKCRIANVTLLEEYHGIFDENCKYVLYNVKCNQCGNNFYYRLSVPPYCRSCNPISIGQSEVYNYVKSIYKGNVEYDNRSILSGKELDVYLPDLKLGIEYDGSYWHNNKHTNLEKFILSKSKDIEIVFIHDYEWYDERKNEIIKSILKSKIVGDTNVVFAMECEIVKLEKQDCFDFLNQNHLQGACDFSIAFGILYEGELVQLMAFKKLDKVNWEIVRDCTRLDWSIIGGEEKLLNCFEKNYRPNSILVQCDARYFSGKQYERCGFNYEGLTKENYVYVTKDIQTVISPKSIVDELEKENMLKNGYLIMYDAGLLRYIKECK